MTSSFICRSILQVKHYTPPLYYLYYSVFLPPLFFKPSLYLPVLSHIHTCMLNRSIVKQRPSLIIAGLFSSARPGSSLNRFISLFLSNLIINFTFQDVVYSSFNFIATSGTKRIIYYTSFPCRYWQKAGFAGPCHVGTGNA